MKAKKEHTYVTKWPKYKIISMLTIIFMLAQYASYPVLPATKGYAADDSLTISSDYTLEEDVEVSALTVDDGTLDLNGHTLTIDGDLSQMGGTIDLNLGNLKINGDLNQSGGTFNTNKGKVELNGSYLLSEEGNLKMATDRDYFYVGKDFTVANDYYENNLIAGTIEIKGDFTQRGSYYDYNFTPSGTNKVILSGTDKQSVSFDDPEDNHFNILKLTKPLPVGYSFNSSVNWKSLDETGVSVNGENGGDLTLSSDWKLPYDIEISSLSVMDGTLDLNGHTLTIDGDVTQVGGTINLNLGNLKIDGDFNQSGGTFNTNKGKVELNGSYSLSEEGNLKMATDRDYFYVGNDFTVANDYYENNLIAGTIEVKGDFNQRGSYYDYNFTPSGTHKVILSGTGKQTISFDDPEDNYFNILQVTKPLLTGYTFTTKVKWNKLIQVTQNVPVSSVTLDKSNLSLTMGDTPVTLNATIAPSNATNKKVTWSSSNTNIVKVDANGVVTPVAVGTATITVTTTDGNKTAKCTVTVNPKTIAVTGIKLSTNSLSLKPGDASVKLQSTISPANATNKNVSWTSSNPDVASVDGNGNVTPVSAGSTTISVTTEDGNKSATCSVTVTAKTTVPSEPTYTLDDLVSDSDLFNDILGEYTIDQIHIMLPATYIQEIKVSRNDSLKISTFEIHVNEDAVDRVNITAGGKTYPLTTKGDGVFSRSISGLTKGSEFIVKAYDENGKKVDENVQRVIPMDYVADIPTKTDYTLEELIEDTTLFNSLLDVYTLDQLQVILPVEYIDDVQTTYSSITTKFVVKTNNEITKVVVEVKGQKFVLTNKGEGRFERAIAGLARGTTFKVYVYNMDGELVEQKAYRVK